MSLCLVSFPYKICEDSLDNLTDFATPCLCAGKLIGAYCSLLFEKPSANAGSQTPFCEWFIKFDECVGTDFMNVLF